MTTVSAALASRAFHVRNRLASALGLHSLKDWWETRSSAERLGWMSAIFLLALAVPTTLALFTDARLLNGINVWIKPLKFQVSLAIHMATLALLVWALAPALRSRWFVMGLMMLAAASSLFEIGYITLRAGQGLHSHFDTDTAMESLAYTLMGVGAVSLILVAMVLAIMVWFRTAPDIGPGLRSGILSGGIIGFVSTLIVAGTMSSGDLRFASGLQNDAGGLPVVGWDRQEGDLRVSHFFATHMFQLLPLVGFAADRFANGRVGWVWGAGAIGSALVGFTFWQALQGQPFLPFLG